MTNHSEILDTPDIEKEILYFEDKSLLKKVISFILRGINLIANSCMWISFFVFYYFVFQAAKIIGHIPIYGDKEFVHIGMNDKYEIIDYYLDLGIFGFLISAILMISNSVLKIYKARRVSVMLGIIGFLLQIIYVFSPQFTWYAD